MIILLSITLLVLILLWPRNKGTQARQPRFYDEGAHQVGIPGGDAGEASEPGPSMGIALIAPEADDPRFSVDLR